ncbi:MAG: ABC transporter ATP-binding protein [Actinomycetota bacterium]|jgi:iron complex transport system ATP-binding protein
MSSVALSRLSVRYGKRTVVHEYTETIKPGDWLCLIGPNGAGKSSILRAVAGLAAHTGEINVDGSPLRLRTPRRRAELVAYVPQSPVLPDEMLAFEYVLLGRNPYVSYFGGESAHDREMVHNVLRRLDLDQFADRELGSLSGGEQQRLVIARALAQEAPILLLDEPTSALDIGHQQQALELVDRLRRENGLTVISAMHDLTLAGLYADRLALLHEGHLVVAGTAAQVLRAETLAEFYGVSVTVHHEPDGTVVVVPRRVS